MPKIIRVAPHSPAENAQLSAGDELISIDNAPVRDALELRYREGGEILTLRLVTAAGKRRKITIQKEFDESLGIGLPPEPTKRCNNRCVFCFIDQLPRGLRRELYLKDGDFRLSFLYGNYLTLTNLTEDDFRRIEEQALSPLYVSVHSTEPGLRGRLLGRPRGADIMRPLGRLAAAGISLHTQFVLCPGLNDGAHLESSLRDLALLGDNLLSVAVVPVGLTKHRKELPSLKRWTPGSAHRLLDWFHGWKTRHEVMGRKVQLADEFYLLAGREVPPAKYYRGYDQLDNGVGLVRLLIDRLRRFERAVFVPPPRPVTYILVTGALAAGVLESHFVPILERIRGVRVRLLPVRNRLLGSGVTVAGLLSGGDMLRAVRRSLRADGRPRTPTVLLPPFCTNQEGLMLDDLRPEDLAESLGLEVRVASFHPRELFRSLGLIGRRKGE